MAAATATTAITFAIGSTSYTSKSPGVKAKSHEMRCSSYNNLRSFSGLKAATSVNCEQEMSFLGKESSAALRKSIIAKTAKQNHKFEYHLQPRASAFKVAILGAAGGIGQPLALLIKMSPLVSALHLYDIANVKGVAADLSHCNTPSEVLDFTGPAELAKSLNGVDVVVIPAGVPRKPGMTRDDLFNINANIVRTLVEAVADNCPDAFIHIISNPVNSTVPIAAEVLKQKGVYNPKKLFGVTTLDVVRANTFVAQKKNLKLIDVDVPVVGGHAGITILPLLSKTKPSVSFTDEEVEELTVRIQNAGTEVVEAKAGAGSATLSMAYAAARFVESSLRALDGDSDVYECSFVQSDLTEVPFFASRVKLGRKGVEAIISADLQGLTEYEAKALEAMKPELKASIDKGVAFAQKQMLQIRLIKGATSSEGGGTGAKPSAVDTVTVACPDHLVIADLPVGKSLGSVPTNAAVVKTVGRRSRRLLGERVHFCVRCDFPIAIYGRLTPCEHAFCLACARTDSSCYLCDERIQKIQTIKMLEGIYVCAAPHCLKSFLKKQDFESHIHQNHAHLLQRSNAAAVDKEGSNTELPASSSVAVGNASDAFHGKHHQQPPLPPGDSQPRQAVFSPTSNSQHTHEDKARRYHQSSPREPSVAGGSPMPNPTFYGHHPNQTLPSEPQRNDTQQYQQGFDRQPPFNTNANWFPLQHQSIDYHQGGSVGHFGRNTDRFPDKHPPVQPESSPLPEYPLMSSHQQQQQPPNFPGPANMNTPGPPLMIPFGYHAPPYGVGATQMPPSESLAGAGQGLAGGYGNSLADSKSGGLGPQGQGTPSYYQGDYGWGPGGGKAGPDTPSGSGTAEYHDGKGLLAPMPLPFPPPHPPLSHINQSKFSSSGPGAGDIGREGGMGYAWQNDMRGSGSGQD
ncbi:hypothetical protein H6P81_010962 [Aristolochia fimbriata]|uniref:malate dehydrogenase n=1 Tax=Aristolochia fimbriata TaxID=158543 RepID=A0AAV7EQ75_ARIFI|nr:hypothetical protein H6P81_010962 [Aristolochia fimbriata]